MFFISWGSRVLQRLFGEPSVHDCSICREQRTFRNVVVYKIYHVWWLFRWVANKEFLRVCTVCNNGVRVDEHDVIPKGTKSPIPFMDRMGWATGLGGVAALAAMISVAGAAQSHREDAWLGKPQVNDIYEVDLAKMTAKPEANVMYSTLEVVRVSGDTVDVRLPKTYFNRLSGVTSAVGNGRAKSPDFYGDKVLSFQVAALHKMHDNGAIISVDR